MVITKKHISRRTMLQGMGSLVALPFLEAMVPAQTPLNKTAAKPKSRFAAIEVVHGSSGSTVYGINKGLWSPLKEGSDFEFGSIVKPLEPFRDYVTFVSNTDCGAAMPKSAEEVGADHFRNAAVYLTASHPKQTLGSDIYCGTSIDQMYAQRFGQDTPVPSIQLCTEVIDNSGPCAYKYSCVYMDTISWSSPTTPLPMIYNPRAAFEELFGTGGTQQERVERQRLSRSILDGISHDVARLSKDLGARDRSRLDGYLTNVREIERRIQAIEKYNASNVQGKVPSAPVGVPDSWDEHVRLMMDLQVAAFTGNATRVGALKLGKDVSGRIFPESGTTTPFHSASHHADAPAQIENFAKINRYHVALLAYFIDKLKNTPDGDGNLLDHSLVFYGSAMANSDVHGHIRVPVVLIGHASGALNGNLHVRYPDGTPQANILLTICHKLGMEDIQSVGDSTGTVAI
jgi:hypothetical protein